MNKSIILSAMLALSMPALAADVLYVNGFGTQTIKENLLPAGLLRPLWPFSQLMANSL